MSTPAWVTFSAHAADYTALRRRLVPTFDAFYASAVEALRIPGVRPIRRVLDLGAGTGLLTAFVAEAFPDARFDLLDGSEQMLAEARTRLGDVVDAVHVADMATGVPVGPYDAVISALAIHHLEDPDKRALFANVFGALADGGVFVNAEQTGGPTPALAELYRQRWAADVRAQGGSEEEIEAARLRRLHDRCSPVEDQLVWLRAAGFRTADCTYKHWELATLVAVKGEVG